MDNNKKAVIEKRIMRTGEKLKKNNMEFYYAETSADIRKIVKSLISEGDVITNGGTMTMQECGLYDMLSSPEYNYIDRSKVAPEEVRDVYIKAFSADVYITSSNAITEDGVLYNVDGNSNRVAALLYGPKSVIVVCGINKIVKNIDEAIKRVKTIAAPQNTIRLGIETPCGKTGECVSLRKENPELCDGCHGDTRICCNYVVSAQQRHIDRIKVIIIGEEYGY